MNATGSNSKGCSFGQYLVDESPRYDNQVRKRRRSRKHQALNRGSGLIRPDKRYKVKYL